MSASLPPPPKKPAPTGKARRLGVRHLVRGCLITFAFASVAGCALSTFGIVALVRVI